MATCTYCNRSMSFFESLTIGKAHRCKNCEGMLNQVVTYWQGELTRAFESGGVTDHFERSLYNDLQQRRMPEDLASPIIRRVGHLRSLSEIQWGNIPIIQVSIHLDSDETAHFSLPVTYQKPNKEIKLVPGRLIGTNKTMYFVSDTGRGNAKLALEY